MIDSKSKLSMIWDYRTIQIRTFQIRKRTCINHDSIRFEFKQFTHLYASILYKACGM